MHVDLLLHGLCNTFSRWSILQKVYKKFHHTSSMPWYLPICFNVIYSHNKYTITIPLTIFRTVSDLIFQHLRFRSRRSWWCCSLVFRRIISCCVDLARRGSFFVMCTTYLHQEATNAYQVDWLPSNSGVNAVTWFIWATDNENTGCQLVMGQSVQFDVSTVAVGLVCWISSYYLHGRLNGIISPRIKGE